MTTGIRHLAEVLTEPFHWAGGGRGTGLDGPVRHRQSLRQIISLGVIGFTLTGRVRRYFSARSPTIWGLSGKLANGGHHDRVR